MLGDNWYLFLLIIMIIFLSDGNLSQRETTVMLAILGALALTDSSDNAVSTDCFCNRNI